MKDVRWQTIQFPQNLMTDEFVTAMEWIRSVITHLDADVAEITVDVDTDISSRASIRMSRTSKNIHPEAMKLADVVFVPKGFCVTINEQRDDEDYHSLPSKSIGHDTMLDAASFATQQLQAFADGESIYPMFNEPK